MKIERKIDCDPGLDLDVGPVLVVDDSKPQRKILCALLRRLGYKVLDCATGQEALDLSAKHAVSIVVSDWMMPGMDGLELCAQIRKTVSDRYVYFILLTSKSGKDDVARGFDAGADDFLTKPVNGAELRARMSAAERILVMEYALHQKNQEVKTALRKIRTLYDALDQDLREARKMQHALIPPALEISNAATVRFFLQSSGQVGGDLVGSYPAGDNRTVLYSIDVSGHGVASALLTVRLAGYLSAHSPERNIAMDRTETGYVASSPGETVARLNALLLNELETELYFTICLVEVDTSSGDFTLCQAGHPHPAVRRISGEVEFLGNGGLPVGLLADAEFEETTGRLSAGDQLLLYSDGITEAQNPKGQLLDEDGLAAILRDLPRNPMAFERGMMDRLRAFADGRGFDDDVSMVFLSFTQ